MKRIKIHPFAATVSALCLFVTAAAQTNSATASPPQAMQSLKVTRGNAPSPQMREAENFTGLVGVELLQEATAPSHLAAGRVTFAQGARTAWHSH